MPKRIAFLDQLRAIAIIPVIVCHYYSPWLPGGGIGVGIFFALSGYLISNILLGIQGFGRRAAATFIFRRFMRIYPAYVAAIFAILLSETVDPQRSAAMVHALPGLLTMTDQPAWVGYSIGVLWTLHVEFAFYLLMPIAMLLFGQRPGLLVVCLYLIARSLLGAFVPMLSIGRLDYAGSGGALAIGGLVAYALRSGIPLPGGKYLIAGCLAGLGVLLFLPTSNPTAWRFEILASSFLSSGLISSHLRDGDLQIAPGLEIIGLVSYSLYLVHGLVIDYAYSVFGLRVSPFDVELFPSIKAFAAITFLVSAFSFLVIERTGNALGARISKRLFLPRAPRTHEAESRLR